MGREKVPDAVVDGSDRSADGKKTKMKMKMRGRMKARRHWSRIEGAFLLGTDLAVRKRSGLER